MGKLIDAINDENLQNTEDPWDEDEGCGNYFDYLHDLTAYLTTDTLFLEDSPVTQVDSYGGEGQGDQYWYVLRWKDEFVKVEGYYNSWDGGYFDDAYSVIPREITKTEWDKV